MCLLSFAVFLRSKELINIKRSDVSFFSDHIEIFIESSQTDIYRDGTKIVVAKLFSDLCPVRSIFQFSRYSEDTHGYVFAAVTKSERGYKMRNCVKPLSYTKVREIFIEAFTGIVDEVPISIGHL